MFSWYNVCVRIAQWIEYSPPKGKMGVQFSLRTPKLLKRGIRMKILSINAGSSSLKFSLFNMKDESVIASGIFERIGIDGSYTIKFNGEKIKEDAKLDTHVDAVNILLEKLIMNELTLTECSKRRLDDTYIVVYAIKNEINIKKADYIEKSDIYTLIGIDIKGYRQFLNIYQDRINNNRFWLDCFEGLKSRGVKNILFLSVDDNKNIKRTAKIAFPDIVFVWIL